MGRDFDWLTLINKRAAIKEQFPTYAAVLRERPGTPEDRERRARWHRDNLVSAGRIPATVIASDLVVRENADRFIAVMRERQRALFVAKLSARSGQKEVS